MQPRFVLKANSTTLAIALFAAIVSLSMRAQGSDIIAPDAKLQKLAGDFEFTEGPAADKEGNVFFTDQPNDRIVK